MINAYSRKHLYKTSKGDVTITLIKWACRKENISSFFDSEQFFFGVRVHFEHLSNHQLYRCGRESNIVGFVSLGKMEGSVVDGYTSPPLRIQLG